jgi:uncharacterized protein (DUF885 family)
MRVLCIAYVFILFILFQSCNNNTNQIAADNADNTFKQFEPVFMDAYWKHNPSSSIFTGYGKYYEELVIPDSASFVNDISFSKQWLDSLHAINYKQLNDNNKITFDIIENNLQSAIWYNDTFKIHQWDPSAYNLNGECYYIINQPYAPLDERLRILSKHIMHADDYYSAALHNLYKPVREYTALAIQQNLGGLDVFGSSLADSINASHLSVAEKDTLNAHVSITVKSIKAYTDSLQKMLDDKNTSFRNFAIGKELFTQKFKYDLQTDFTPEEIYSKALADKDHYIKEMYATANDLWSKYETSPKPADSIALIQAVIDKISLHHANPAYILDTCKNLVHALEKFIIQKDLFDFDTTYPVIVRTMPAYEAGVTLASAEFTPPYQKQGDTYFNVEDLSKLPAAQVESSLREYNDYSLQMLAIHEAMPGHCLQGVYNNKKSPDIIRSVFQNGAMIEGWAVYTETMMIENGWADHAPEMLLIHDKWKLRELANVLIDYDMQCLSYSKNSIMKLLTHDCFQTTAQAEEKYHRATVSQVQLCSYYAGSSAIFSLRDEYKNKEGSKFNLKDFHEKFLSYGSSPVKYIRERMLSN